MGYPIVEASPNICRHHCYLHKACKINTCGECRCDRYCTYLAQETQRMRTYSTMRRLPWSYNLMMEASWIAITVYSTSFRSAWSILSSSPCQTSVQKTKGGIKHPPEAHFHLPPDSCTCAPMVFGKSGINKPVNLPATSQRIKSVGAERTCRVWFHTSRTVRTKCEVP